MELQQHLCMELQQHLCVLRIEHTVLCTACIDLHMVKAIKPAWHLLHHHSRKRPAGRLDALPVLHLWCQSEIGLTQ